MNESTEPTIHYICTLEEAKNIVSDKDIFWVLDCGCRTQYSDTKCKRSRVDVCLFMENYRGEAWSANLKEITKQDMEAIFKEAKDKQLVSRPFRDFKTRSRTVGICFCCDCCCGYFKSGDEVCEKGKYIEITNMEACTHCGDCEKVCYFMARVMSDDELFIDRNKCYGCGLCIGLCPEKCIELINRN
jgi:ferredoxin